MNRRQALGAAGEDAAARWYEAAGYQIVARNWRCPEGEIDLVACRGATLVFCEVKARRSAAFGTPAEAVTGAKQRRLRNLARLYLSDRSARSSRGLRPRTIRFDVAAILAGDLEIIEDAF